MLSIERKIELLEKLAAGPTPSRPRHRGNWNRGRYSPVFAANPAPAGVGAEAEAKKYNAGASGPGQTPKMSPAYRRRRAADLAEMRDFALPAVKRAVGPTRVQAAKLPRTVPQARSARAAAKTNPAFSGLPLPK